MLQMLTNSGLVLCVCFTFYLGPTHLQAIESSLVLYIRRQKRLRYCRIQAASIDFAMEFLSLMFDFKFDDNMIS